MTYGRTALSILVFLALSGLAVAQSETLSYVSILLMEARNELQYHELVRVQALLAGANALIDETLVETCAPLADAKPLLEQAISARSENEIWEPLEEIDTLIATCEDQAFASTASDLGQIAFVSDQDLDAFNEIYVMTADGAKARRLTASPYESENPEALNAFKPAWSPDGTQIAYTSEDNIYILDVNTGESQQIIEDASSPAWSPDGTRIAFTSQREGSLDLFVMLADGTEIERLTNDPVGEYNPAWSPDGTQIAFTSYRGGGGLYIMSADGTDVTLLTTEGGGMLESTLAWSPDGTQIAFNGYFNDGSQIAVVNVDGTDVRVLTDDQFENESPTWSPDGTQIMFTSYRDGDAEIYLMDPDGSNVQALTNNLYNDYSPVWSKAGGQPE